MGRSERHLAPEALHAYAAGEVDPTRREAFEAHLAACEACRAQLQTVRGVQELMRAAGRPDLDELSWRRLQLRVRTQLLEEARGSGLTQDLSALRSRWRTAALVAVAAVALLVWFAPRGDGPPAKVSKSAQVAVRHVLAREAPVDLTLRSGVELELGARGRLELRPGPGSGATLLLATGELVVRDLRPPAVHRPIRVEATPYLVTATHADLVIRRLADGAEVEVLRGKARVAVPSGRPVEVSAGARRVFRPSTATAPPARAAQPPPERPARRAEAPQVAPAAPPPASTEAPLPPGSAPRTTSPSAAAPADAPAPNEPEVTVSVEPPDDPIRARLVAARRAYYVDGDLDRAISLAKGVVTEATGSAERWSATDLLCQAHTARGDADAAVRACGELLKGPLDRATRRTLHKQIADIHRTQRQDCKTAIEHYNHVLVFGLSTPLDDDARLWRAECALISGDLTLAERDLAQLEASSSFRRRDALERLRTRLREMRGPQDRRGVTDSR